jgi:hypothetical protein
VNRRPRRVCSQLRSRALRRPDARVRTLQVERVLVRRRADTGKHFADKRELLAAVSAAGFEALTKRMAREVAGHDNAGDQLFPMLRA